MIFISPCILKNNNFNIPSTALKDSETKSKKETSSEQGYRKYTVAAGDTLFGISSKLNIPLEELAELNGITDPNQIKVGQVLKIPNTNTVGAQKIEIDLSKMKEIQTLVDEGKQLWRLDPVEVTKVESPEEYQFTATDLYELKNKDESKGEAVVIITKADGLRKYEALLIQPVKKGSKGVWSLVSVHQISQ